MKFTLKRKSYEGFTLAEVLITLSIIGVIASLTIPSLITKNQEKELVVSLKKSYNTFSNAYSLAKAEYGMPEQWENFSGPDDTLKGCKAVVEVFAPFLSVIKERTPVQMLGGYLSDGSNFSVYSHGSCRFDIGGAKDEALKRSCAQINVDINGEKGPNKVGLDKFKFIVTEKALIPAGTVNDTSWNIEGCKSGTNAYGCTAWVLLKESFNFPSSWKEN